MTDPVLSTDIADHDTHHIWLRGLDLTDDLMGKLSFSDVVFLLVCRRLPDDHERRLVDAILVSLVEHGLTPSAVVARATYASAPESLQGAVAAGLLGAGSVVLGSMEECGRLLTRMHEAAGAGVPIDAEARRIVAEYRAAQARLPGLGHRIHTDGDPRATRLFEIAKECGRAGPHVTAMNTLSSVASEELDRRLPVNVTGAVASTLLELGVPWRLHRGFALISRSAGLVAHIAEELEQPIVPALRRMMGKQEG